MADPRWTADDLDILASPAPAHMGYQNGCVCERCRDRSARARHLRSERRPNADTEAMKQSDAYFKRPWLYRMDPTTGFSRPLKELTDERDR